MTLTPVAWWLSSSSAPLKCPEIFFQVSPTSVSHVFTKSSVWHRLQEGSLSSTVHYVSSCLLSLQVCPLLPGSRPGRLSLMFPLSPLPGVTQWCWVLEAVWRKDSPQLPWPWIYSVFPKTIRQAPQNQQLLGIILSPWSPTLQKTQSAKCELTAPTIETENFSELMAASLHTH